MFLISLCRDYRHNEITGVGAEKIYTTLMAIESPLESLYFDYNYIDGHRLRRIPPICQHCKLLNGISFSHNPLTDTGLYYLLQALMNPTRKAYAKLPLPPALLAAQSNSVVDMENDNLELIEDIGTDEDSEPKVLYSILTLIVTTIVINMLSITTR